MLNIIKMDLYRLRRTKSLWMGLIITAVISFGMTALAAGLMALIKAMMEMDPTAVGDIASMYAMFPFLAWGETGIDLSIIVHMFSGILTLAMSAVISAVFINEEQTSGFGKNYLGQLPQKGTSALSKMIVTSIISVLVILVGTLASAGAGALFFAKSITGLNAGNLALTMVLRLLMYLAINAIIVFVSLLTKSKSASMIIGVVFGIGASKIAYTTLTSGLNFLVGSVLKLKDVTVPSISGLVPDGVEGMLDANFLLAPDEKIIIRTLIVAAVYIIGFSVASFFIVRKRDVK